jgi:hypothetical protein
MKCVEFSEKSSQENDSQNCGKKIRNREAEPNSVSPNPYRKKMK